MNVAVHFKSEGNMAEKETIFYRRNLPHIHPQDAIFFITFGLVNSIPAAVLQKLQKERDDEIKQLKKKSMSCTSKDIS